MSLKITGMDSLIKEFSTAPGRLAAGVEKAALQEATKLKDAAQAGAPVAEDGGGRTRQSIQAFHEQTKDGVTAGARTDYSVAWYNEFGTGPVGAASGHPKASELGITHRMTGWTYWSDKAAQMRADKGGDGANGFVYTEGMPAKAFMYNAMVSREEAIMETFGAVVREVFR
ncbi:MAG: hypothetical protein LUH36_05890 [Oscillospiraceae bacterium]|nr:hypothetical protein [Oscillospiraceae bacterium]